MGDVESPKKKPSIEAEDRISTLPDALIHRILSFLDSDLAVQTCVLSKRWVNLWSTLPFLNFEPRNFDSNAVYYRKFVTDLFFNRNHQSDTSSIKISFKGFDESITTNILDYAISHNVERFSISNANINSSLSFPILKILSFSLCKVNLVKWSLPSLETLHFNFVNFPNAPLSFPLVKNLHLSRCKVSLSDWSLPSLTTLHLDDVNISRGETRVTLGGFNNLKKLTLIGCPQFSRAEVFMINSPNLTSLTISHTYIVDGPLTCAFMVSAPMLSFFKFQGNCVPMLSAVDGFPLLNQVDLDIFIDKYGWKEYNSEEKKNQLIQKLISLFREFQNAKSLALSFMTIQVLSRLPRLSEYQPSPFGTLKSLNMLGSRWKFERLIDLPDHVLIYLLSTSPCAKIFVEERWGVIKNYNPTMNVLLWNHGCPVITSKASTLSSTKNDALNEVPKPEDIKNKTNSSPQSQEATSNVEGNGDDIHKVLGVIHPTAVRKALNDKTCSYKEKNTFSLWEGHQNYSEYVDLLTRIKDEHPETFENFAPQTEIMYNMGLNTLCSIVQAFSEDSTSNLTAGSVTRYRCLFSDLEKWGFNTTWLVNRLGKT